MFSGIVSDVGRVVAVDKERGNTRLVIEGALPRRDLAMGASVACHGVCLTVMKRKGGKGGIRSLLSGRRRFCVMASPETVARTDIGTWQEGRSIHLEGALRLGDAVGGHLMFGHVDGLAMVSRLQAEGASLRMWARLPQDIMPVHGSAGFGGYRWCCPHDNGCG